MQPSITPVSPAGAIRTLRVIGGSLGAGVTLFALVTWFLHHQGTAPLSADDSGLFFTVWILVATGAALAAMAFWRARVGPVIQSAGSAPGAPRADWQARARDLTTGVIIAWALIEGATIFGVTIYFLFGHALAGALALALMWIALAVTWPRHHWLDRRGRSGG